MLGDFTVCADCEIPPFTIGPDQEPLARPPIKYAFAHLNHGFAEVYLTLRMERDKLVVEDDNLFKDGSGRPDYRMRYELVRAKAE